MLMGVFKTKIKRSDRVKRVERIRGDKKELPEGIIINPCTTAEERHALFLNQTSSPIIMCCHDWQADQ